ncbi:MAG: MBL fold metallo-hydrolase [Bacillota bacterium]
MIERHTYEDVIQFKLGRAVKNQVLYWVAVYLVDGLLIDTGPAHTAHELLEELRGKKVEKAVNTHYHEDHLKVDCSYSKHRLLDDVFIFDPYLLNRQSL